MKGQTFDWSLERLGHGDHDVGTEDPEDIVHEETSKKNATGHNLVQTENLYARHGKSKAEDVVSDPMLKRQLRVSFDRMSRISSIET